MRGLYAIIDIDTLTRRGVEPLPFVEAVLDARPAAIQLRDKNRGAKATLDTLRSMAPLCARAGVPFFANDRPDLAILARCDGVHLGRDDVPPDLARALVPAGAPSLRVGVSTHNTADVHEAIREAPDYIAVGPVFPTASKERPSPVVGISGLRDLAALIRCASPGVPIVAIGGVTLENAALIGSIADCVAVIGALFPPFFFPPSSPGAPDLKPGAQFEAIRDHVRAMHAAVVGTKP